MPSPWRINLVFTNPTGGLVLRHAVAKQLGRRPRAVAQRAATILDGDHADDDSGTPGEGSESSDGGS
jgi:hypothetical protein